MLGRTVNLDIITINYCDDLMQIIFIYVADILNYMQINLQMQKILFNHCANMQTKAQEFMVNVAVLCCLAKA